MQSASRCAALGAALHNRIQQDATRRLPTIGRAAIRLTWRRCVEPRCRATASALALFLARLDELNPDAVLDSFQQAAVTHYRDQARLFR